MSARYISAGVFGQEVEEVHKITVDESYTAETVDCRSGRGWEAVAIHLGRIRRRSEEGTGIDSLDFDRIFQIRGPIFGTGIVTGARAERVVVILG